jgi:BlaI family penicillinase repressor
MKAPLLTRQELEIMKIVWERKTATVRDVYETLRQERPIAYTTVMTMMKILERKQFLLKWQQDRAYVYEACRPKEQIIKGMVRDFVERVFDGAAQPLLMQLARDRHISKKDLDVIAQMVREKSR